MNEQWTLFSFSIETSLDTFIYVSVTLDGLNKKIKSSRMEINGERVKIW